MLGLQKSTSIPSSIRIFCVDYYNTVIIKERGRVCWAEGLRNSDAGDGRLRGSLVELHAVGREKEQPGELAGSGCDSLHSGE